MIRLVCRLLRLRLALLNGIVAMGGYLLYPGPTSREALAATLGGVMLLAAGGSAFNQLSERDLDRLMERTRSRPLPSGELTPAAAAVLGGLCVLVGSGILRIAGGPLPPLLGLLALLCYLGVYTPLKGRTSLALLCGAVSGALPPLIGWTVAGGNPADYRVLLMAGLLFLWQVPHFWLLQQRHAADYRKAGFRLFAPTIDGGSTCRLWLAALSAGALLFPALGIVDHRTAICYALFPVPLAVLAMLRADSVLFGYLNLFPLLVTLTLFWQR